MKFNMVSEPILVGSLALAGLCGGRGGRGMLEGPISSASILGVQLIYLSGNFI